MGGTSDLRMIAKLCACGFIFLVLGRACSFALACSPEPSNRADRRKLVYRSDIEKLLDNGVVWERFILVRVKTKVF